MDARMQAPMYCAWALSWASHTFCTSCSTISTNRTPLADPVANTSVPRAMKCSNKVRHDGNSNMSWAGPCSKVVTATNSCHTSGPSSGTQDAIQSVQAIASSKHSSTGSSGLSTVASWGYHGCATCAQSGKLPRTNSKRVHAAESMLVRTNAVSSSSEYAAEDTAFAKALARLVEMAAAWGAMSAPNVEMKLSSDATISEDPITSIRLKYLLSTSPTTGPTTCAATSWKPFSEASSRCRMHSVATTCTVTSESSSLPSTAFTIICW
mmetsp:Transcript_29349/g.95793  ORF Transcript_29349/g.95793 Transcript_29349/m.95793 type:complete len:266 (-) Transcript_29349:198-995(-)